MPMINEVTPHNPRETIPDGRLEANRYRSVRKIL